MTNLKPVGTFLLDASGSSISTSAWTIIAAKVILSARFNQILNTTGATLAISTGAPGLEAANLLPYTILQGVSGDLISIEVPNNAPLTIKSLDNPSSAGILVLNLFG